jgi:hypothetical protein
MGLDPVPERRAYRRREQPPPKTRTAVAEGSTAVHKRPCGEIEHVTKRTDRYWVVEKDGEAAELAARADRRRTALRAKSAAQLLFTPTKRS